MQEDRRFIPRAMDPPNILGASVLFSTHVCVGCHNEEPSILGVFYSHTYRVDGTLVYAAGFWCSFNCILEHLPHEGTG